MSAYFPLGGSNSVLGPTPTDGSADPTNALNIAGNAAFAGNISAGNMGMFRNRVINGDMRVDQRNAGNAGNSGFGPDRFKVVGSNCAASVLPRRIELTPADVAATGGSFQYATSLSTIAGPTAGLATYIGFNSNLTDAMGGISGPTVTGTVRYVPGVMGGSSNATALYLANEANAVAIPTRASNILSYSFVQSTALTVSCWVYITKLPAANSSFIWSFGTSSSDGFFLITDFVSTTRANIRAAYTNIGSTPTAPLTSNQWYNIVVVYIPSTSISLYINGGLIGSITTSIPANFGSNGLLSIGESANTVSAQPFAGYIDDFRIYNRALGTGEIALLAGLTTGISSAPSSGLAAYYPFDGSTTETSGNSGPALTTTGSVSYVTGAIDGQSVYLANEGNVLATPTKASNRLSGTYTVSGAISLSLWIKFTKLPQATSQYSTLLQFGTTTTPYFGIACLYSSLTVANLALYPGGATGSTFFPVTIGVWYHITAVWVPSANASLYINGSHITTFASSAAAFTNGTLLLGDNTVTASIQPFAGYIDDFRIYNRALTSAEIAYLAGNAPYPSIQTFNQAAYFPFDGALTDASGNGVTLTPTGAMQYVTGVTGTQALYLANEANVVAQTAAANYVRNTSFVFPSAFTVGFWVNSTSANSSEVFRTNSGSGALTNSLGIYFGSSGGTIVLSFLGIASINTSFSSLNRWVYILFTYIPGTAYLYVNGTYINSLSGTLAQSGFILGNSGTAVTTPFAGYIDDFRIYNTALTQSQISALYYGSAQIANQATPYLGYVPSAAVLYQQSIEGNNVADLFYGTANAKPVAVSFWLKNATASAQSFTLALNNGGTGGTARSALYPIASVAANTWRRVTIKVPGDLIGTWARDNGLGLNLALVLGTNSNVLTSTASAWQTGAYYATDSAQNYAGSATGFLALQDNAVYVTGVQLEKGTLVTPFEFRPVAVETGLCQRYFWNIINSDFAAPVAVRFASSYNQYLGTLTLPVKMRVPAAIAFTPGVKFHKPGYLLDTFTYVIYSSADTSTFCINIIPTVDSTSAAICGSFSTGVTSFLAEL